jgi:hypothetical protein
MEYRQGKCAGCGAEYKIPASFQHDAAKCKECGGVVHIGPRDAARPRSTAGPVPARKFAGKREPQPETAEQPTPLARMKAERAAAPAEASGGTLERLKAERAAPPPPAAPAPTPATAAPSPADSRTVAASLPPLRAEPAQPRERTGAGARASRAPAQKKPNLALRAVAVLCLLGAGVGGYLYVTRGGDEEAAPAASQGTEPATPAHDAPAEAPPTPPTGEEPPVDER